MYILPRPKKMMESAGSFLADFGLRIVSLSEELLPQTGFAYPAILKDMLLKWAGVEAELSAGKVYRGDISLEISQDLEKQSYQLIITPENIRILGGDRMAVGYGVSTLCQIIKMEGGFIPCLEIFDKPDLPVRGYYLDQARGRILKLETLKRFVDELAFYKINQFQIYIEQSFLFRGYSEMWREDTVLTASEIIELDRYCREREIDLVPSIASFGHLYELLKTKSYEEICELKDTSGKQFSFIAKQLHHTVAVSNEKSFEIVKDMLDQFLPLFSSQKINICADETFDIGRERSKEDAEKLGKDRLYADFLKKLCNYVSEKGKIPMFWGDVICKSPELIKELPEETICLAWGYMPEQKDDICEPIARVGAKMYLCPGVCTWNNYVGRIDRAYSNIKIMSKHAKTYKAIGLLNTDWGDFGHINDLEFSIPGMIYGAVFGWNLDDTISEEELNRQISALHYTDRSEELLSILREATVEQHYDWWFAVAYFEGFGEEGRYLEEKEPMEFHVHKEVLRRIEEFRTFSKKLDEANERMEVLRISMRRTFNEMDSSYRNKLNIMNNAIWAVSLWNRVGKAILMEGSYDEEAKRRLAGELEFWFMMYKDLYRTSSKEGMLHRVSKVVFWYGDLLRGIKEGAWSYQKD